MKTMISKCVVALLAAVAQVAFGVTPQIVSLSHEGNCFELSFTCNPERNYAIWASENLGPEEMWFLVETVTPGKDYTTLANVEGSSVTTMVLPDPFLHWSNKTNCYLRVSEVAETTSTAQLEYVAVKEMKLVDDKFRVTFQSLPGFSYTVWGSESLGPDAYWAPVDFLVGDNLETVDNVSLSVQAAGDSDQTTVWLPRNFFPCISGKRGFLRVSVNTDFFGGYDPFTYDSPDLLLGPALDLGDSGDSDGLSLGGGSDLGPVMAAAVAVAPKKRWHLVCTRDGSKDLPVVSTGVYTTLILATPADGPDCGWAGKYTIVEGRAIATADPPLLSPIRLEVPHKDEKPNKIKQLICLSHYEGDEEPKVKYIPDPDVRNGYHDPLYLNVRIQKACLVAVAAWKPIKPLKDGISLKPLGVGFEIELPGSDLSLTNQKMWAFSPMTEEMAKTFRGSVAQEYDPPIWDPVENPNFSWDDYFQQQKQNQPNTGK